MTSMGATAQPAQPYRGALAAVHFVMVLTGVMTTLLGPVLPALAARWGLNDSQSGAFFTCQFLGSMTGVLLSGSLSEYLGPRRCMLFGCGLMSVGVGAMSIAPWMVALICTWGYGVGLGFTIPAANLFVAQVNPERRGAALNLLNFAWGVGAILSPWLVGWLGNRNLSTLFLILALALAAASSLPLAAAWPETSPAESRAQSSAFKMGGRHAAVARLAALFFLYVGTEATLSGWLASYAERMHTATLRLAVLMPSIFWAALLAGRALAPAILRKIDEERVALAGLTIAGAGAAVLLLAPGLIAAAAGSAIGGFGLAAIFPLLISAVAERFGASATRITSLMFIMAALGGASLPLLAGFASTRFGSLRAAMVVALLSDAVMLALASRAFVRRVNTSG